MKLSTRLPSLALPILLLMSVSLGLTQAQEMSSKASEGPTLSPLQPVLLRLHHCEATSPFV